MKFGWERPKRLEMLEEIGKAAPGPTFQVPYQGELKHLPIRTVPLEVPMYRLDNGRTEAAQLEYLAQHSDANEHLFVADLESESAQKAQHEILGTLIDEKDLLPFFRDNEQEQPLILTDRGFVLNGNRRLCAFRSLFEEDPKTYARFANVQVVILPHGDDKDLDRLESRLQREQDIQADYPWYADAVKYRRRLESYKDDELAAVEGVTKKQITTYVQMLEYAERFLAYRGVPHRYGLLSEKKAGGGDSFYAFNEIVKGREKLKDAAEKDAFTYASFAQMLDPKGGNYQIIPKFVTYFDQIVSEIKAPTQQEKEADSNGDDLEKLFGAEPKNEMDAKLTFIKDLKNAETIRKLAQDVVEYEDFVKSDSKAQTFVFDRARKAIALLDAAIKKMNEPSMLTTGVQEQLVEIEGRIAEIRKWLSTKA